MLTASPFDIVAFGHTPADIIGRVAMPGPLVELVELFIATHHRSETYVKSGRMDPHPPIEGPRERMGSAEPGWPRG